MRQLLFLLAASALLLARSAGAAILPDTIGDWKKGDSAPAKVSDAKTWSEYGLQESETAAYAANGQKYSISAFRFSDATGALAAFDETRPADARPVTVVGLGAANATDEIVAIGNYVFAIKGYKPKPEELNHLVGTAPHYAQSPLPTLPRYLPPGDIPNSERYIEGPVGLSRFAPSVPPSTAAFHYSAEAQLARYGTPGKETTLLIFSYPTMEMARGRIGPFQAISGAVVKRSGPLVAVALNAHTPDDAERLLAQVRYQAEVTVPEHVPTPKDNPGNLFWNIAILCGILAAFCLVSGLVFGGIRVMFRRADASGEGDAMISLHLSGRP